MASNAGRRAKHRKAIKRSRERKERDKRARREHGEDGHSECGKKRRYATELEAMMVAMDAEQRGALPLRAYKCRFCGGWHLTKRRTWNG